MSDDLMIEIGHGAEFGRYPVRVTHAPSPSGSEREETLHLDLEDLRDRRDNLAKTINIFGRAARRSVPVSEQQIREIGRRLFCALFRESVADTYHQSLGMVQTRRRPLRLVLWLTDPELAALPWESLYDPDSNAFLAKRWPVVRYVRSGYTPPPLEVQRPLRILGLVALPEDTVTLNVEAEQENLENALVDLLREGIVEIEWELETTWNHVQDRLLNKEWHVVHFIGHGGYDEENDESYLQFVSEGGGTQRVQANKLVDLLCNTPLPPRLVVLNSCSSGEGSPGDIFSSTAAALAKGGISAVAAMQFTITDEAAIAFSRGFYRAIAEGLSVDQAVHNGRRAIIGLPGNRMEWVTPVLYVLGETRELFKFAQQSSAAMRSTTPPPTQIQNVAGHYEQARDAEDACDWPAAIHKYKELLAIDPYYRDASARKKACEVQQQVANWQVQLRIHAEQGAWREVVETARELWRLDPSASDPDGLTTKARRNLRAASPRHVSVGSWNIHQVSWHPKGTQLSVATDSAWTRIYRVEDLTEVLMMKRGIGIARSWL